MTRTQIVLVTAAIAVSLIVGLIAGFFMGVASTKAGRAFLRDVAEREQTADISHPKELVREAFRLQYPSNWRINVDDEDYDPDTLFSIESPGSTFVSFEIGKVGIEPEHYVQDLIRSYQKRMSKPVVSRFERYGRFTGKGAMLKGRIMGVKMNARVFSFRENGLTVMISESYADNDLQDARAGLGLIEMSFSLSANGSRKQTNHENGK